MKHKTDTYIFRVAQSIQGKTFNIFWLRKAEEMRNHNNKQKKQHFLYLHFSDVVTLSRDNTLIFMYFTQDLLENWILGVI